jgi:hypothetical protein
MNRRDLQFLQAEQEYPSVSIIVKTHRAMPESQQDPIRVKNAVAEVKKRLKDECDEHDRRKIEQRLDLLVAEIDYTQQLDGLALFVNTSIAQMYKLPIAVEDKVVIDSHFFTRDIVHAINRVPHYWVLALSEKPTRLYYGVGDTLNEIIEPAQNQHGEDQDGFPYDYLPNDIQAFREMAGGVGRNSLQISVHGSAQYFDDCKRKFFERIEHLLSRFTSVDQLPIVLAGTKENCAIFKQVAPQHNWIAEVDADFSHNPECPHVAAAVWPHVEKYLDEQSVKRIEAFTEAIGNMHHAFGIDSVWRVAQEGRIHELLVEEGFSVPGVVNEENPQDLIIYDNSKSVGISDDLVNLLINHVMEKGGIVTFCKPGSLDEYDHIAAILRY